jgi:hypothetical protein
MTRSRLTAVFVSVLALAGSLAVSTPSVAKAPWTCKVRGTDTSSTMWTGGDGDWAEPANWSTHEPPSAASNPTTRVCIKGAVTVTIGPTSGRVDVAALVLAEGATLRINAGAQLFVWDNADASFSLVRAGSTIEVKGGTLGGPGKLKVRGTVRLSPDGDVLAALATSASSGDVVASHGRLVVDEQGRLEAVGSGPSRLTTAYSVKVRGTASLSDKGVLLADHGTSFALLARKRLPGVGTLELADDTGYAEGVDDGAALSRFLNQGRISKIDGGGVSRIAADYSASDWAKNDVADGTLVLPDGTYTTAVVAPGATYGTGVCDQSAEVCGSGTTRDRPQVASFTVPPSADNAAMVMVTQLDDKRAGSLGSIVKTDASELDVSRTSPAVIELRYDPSLLVAPDGSLLGWQDVGVRRSDDGGETWADLPACAKTGAIPRDVVACVDRRGDPESSSRKLDDGDIIMVVRTIRTSRWIAD